MRTLPVLLLLALPLVYAGRGGAGGSGGGSPGLPGLPGGSDSYGDDSDSDWIKHLLRKYLGEESRVGSRNKGGVGSTYYPSDVYPYYYPLYIPTRYGSGGHGGGYGGGRGGDDGMPGEPGY